jgi:hypothetical protein
MPALSDHIENALNESRMLLLGAQVFVGFSYRICFEPIFARMPLSVQLAEVAALTVMTAGLGWVLWTVAFHQIAEHGRETAEISVFATTVLDWALMPFAVGLGLSLYPVVTVLRIPHGAWIAVAGTSMALVAWYGGAFARKDSGAREKARPHLAREEQKWPQRHGTDLPERIRTALIECRMALPGAQAFLGFQFAIVFTDGFGKLPRSTQWIHFGSLLATTIAIVLLIAPAAFHRIAEAGEDTERFHTVASRLLLSALVFLPPGMAGDLYVVLEKVAGSRALAAGVAGFLMLAFYGLWFGASRWKRNDRVETGK